MALSGLSDEWTKFVFLSHRPERCTKSKTILFVEGKYVDEAFVVAGATKSTKEKNVSESDSKTYDLIPGQKNSKGEKSWEDDTEQRRKRIQTRYEWKNALFLRQLSFLKGTLQDSRVK